MRFPNIFQTILLIFLLIIIHWFLKAVIIVPQQDSLKMLIISTVKLILLLSVVSLFIKHKYVIEDNFILKKTSLYLSFVSVLMTLLIVFNPILGSVSLFSSEEIMKYAESILEKQNDLFVFLNLVIVVPIFEEVFFRGLILNGLKDNYNGFIGLLISSVLFGIFHIDVLGSTVMGVWLGWVMFRTNNLLLCILAHSVCNLIHFLFRSLFRSNIDHPFINYVGENTIVISVVMFVLAFVLFYFSSKKFEHANRKLEEQS